jgi:hypothetical protein
LGGDSSEPRPFEAREGSGAWPRFYDFNVWSQSKYVEKLHYLHRNPVKRKRVAPPRDWPWSSFSFYARRDSGLLAIDPLRESGRLGLQSKPPPLQIPRTGHPNFKYVQSPGHPPIVYEPHLIQTQPKITL